MRASLLILIAVISGCSSIRTISVPEGIERNELYFCQSYGNLYANIARGKSEEGVSRQEMDRLMKRGIEKSEMGDALRRQMLKWYPRAVTRVYSAPSVDQSDWRHHVETECLNRILDQKGLEAIES